MHTRETAGANQDSNHARSWQQWRRVAWTVAGLALLAPLLAMQFTEEVAWGVGDFVLFGGMLLLAGAAVETVIRTNPSSIYRYAMGGGLGGAFLLIWVNGAVGLIGAAGNPANLMYAGVLAVGVIGALVGRFRARAMSRVLLAMAVIQTVIMGTAIVMEWGQPSSGPVELVVANGAFAGIWLVSAWLFRKAERDGT